MWPVSLYHALLRTGVCLLGDAGFLSTGAQSAREKRCSQHLYTTVCTPEGFLGRVQTATPIATLPDRILYQAFSKTKVPPTDCNWLHWLHWLPWLPREGQGFWAWVALSLPASWGRQAGGQGCPVILGWLGCDHPKRKDQKRGPPCPVACFHNLALNEPPNASAKQVRAGHEGGKHWHTGAATDAHTSTRRGPCPGCRCGPAGLAAFRVGRVSTSFAGLTHGIVACFALLRSLRPTAL